jgi:hypothetical protein
MKHRKKDRRSYAKIPGFPLMTRLGVVRKDRRLLFDRRARDIQVGWFKA